MRIGGFVPYIVCSFSLQIRFISAYTPGIVNGDCVYFVHSFYATDCDDAVVAVSEYGTELTAAVQNKNVFGCQFHPEKSGKVGLDILKAFAEIKEGEIC